MVSIGRHLVFMDSVGTGRGANGSKGGEDKTTKLRSRPPRRTTLTQSVSRSLSTLEVMRPLVLYIEKKCVYLEV